jgi:hypothetical integral membrane protein (TIGR02206 family)
VSLQQLVFIALTFLVPLGLWWLCKIQPAFEKSIGWLIAGILVTAYITAIVLKAQGESIGIDDTLPMQLCDWAAIATLLAVLKRWPMAFELAYFWGLPGTAQALFTPAVAMTDSPRVMSFLVIHSVIPASVLWLMLRYGLRPRRGSLIRIFAWSELYLISALAVNAMTDGNYGFLSHKPYAPTLLDLLSDTRWLYVIQINAIAYFFFIIFDLPWWWSRRSSGTADAM